MDSGKESGGARAVSPTMQTGETAHYSSRRDEKFETRDESLGRVVHALYSEGCGCFVVGVHFFVENHDVSS